MDSNVDEFGSGRNVLDGISDELTSLSRRLDEESSRARNAAERDPVLDPALVYLDGISAINSSIQEVLGAACTEVLTAQPDGPRPVEVLEEALVSVQAHIAKGVSMRTLYNHSARFDEATKEYVRRVSVHGGRARTLPEFFERLIIVDRATAFIPANACRTSAVRIEDPAVVAFLVDIFERAWSFAEAFPFVPSFATQAATEVLPSMREAMRKLLINGRPDREIARRLGLSQRSVQAQVSRLKEEFGAETRMQLGYILGVKERGAGAHLEEGNGAGRPG